MADINNKFNSTVESLFSGMDSFVSAKTVVGDAVTVNDTIIVPLVDVAFGVGAGAFSGEGKNNAGGGLGAKLSPSAVLVIQNGQTKLVNVKNQDTMTKILDMVPDIVDKVADIAGGKKNRKDEAVDEAINDITGNDNK
ncbi:MAG: GerW family sporulation protein [Lachnospiraceae bacterium]